MKKIMMALLVSFVLTGCNSGKPNDVIPAADKGGIDPSKPIPAPAKSKVTKTNPDLVIPAADNGGIDPSKFKIKY